MRDTKITIKIRFDVNCNEIKDFGSGVEFFEKYLGQSDESGEEYVFWDGNIRPTYKNNRWYLEVVLTDLYSYEFDFIVFDEDIFNDALSTLYELFGHRDFHSPRLSICHLSDGANNPLDLKEW